LNDDEDDEDENDEDVEDNEYIDAMEDDNLIDFITCQGVKYKVIKEIFRAQAFIGRGTRVWLVRRCDDGRGLYVLKESWIPTGQSSEAHFLENLEIPNAVRPHCPGRSPDQLPIFDRIYDSRVNIEKSGASWWSQLVTICLASSLLLSYLLSPEILLQVNHLCQTL